MSEFPNTWARVSLGEVADFEMGQAPPGSSCNKDGRGTVFVKAGEFGVLRPIVREWTTEPLKFAKQDDVLICVVGATSGKLNLGIDCAIGRSVAAIRPSASLNQKVLYCQLQLQVEQLRADSTGTAQGVISKQMLADIQLLVPPTPEQTRIADQLDTLLARINACNDRFNAIPALLKRFRQAVLVAALAGDFSESVVFETRRVSDLANVGTGSTPLRSTGSFYSTSGTPWITSAGTSKAIITSANEYVTAAAIAAHRLKIYPVGTLLVAMYGEGKTRGQVAELGIAATINQACAAIVVDPKKAVRSYVKLALQANYLAMREMAEGGNQPNLNLSKIKEFVIPYPSLAEQTEIVSRVETLFALADRIEAGCNVARAKAQRLTPLLLAKAFRGELLPQDPNDEPASVLLARIQAERVANSAGAPTAQRKPRAAAQAKAKPKTRAQRKPKESSAMTKSRQDDDVNSKPYLAGHLRRLGAPATAAALFKAAELPVADFYKQLAWEVSQGHIQDGNDGATLLEASDAA